MAGGWAGEVASTSRSTAGQDDHHVEDDEEVVEEIDEYLLCLLISCLKM